MSRKKISDETKEQARLAYLSGDSPEEVGAAHGVTGRAVRNWAKQGGWVSQRQDRNQTAANLEAQIAKLSKGGMNGSKAQRIAMLTRALERLKRIAPTPKPKPVVRAALHQELLNIVLAPEYGLYPYQRDFLQSDARYELILKSRQIGFSYILALRALLACAAGRNQIILSASQEQSEILIDYAIQHAARLGLALDATSKSELTLGTATIRAMPANQRTIQGFAGDVILDEFAWHLRQRNIWRAVIPSITAVGGRITVCSTPFVQGNLFFEIAENYKNKYAHFQRTKITIHDAVAQGMTLPGGIEELRLNFDSESWAMMYECEWAEDGDALLSWELLQQSATVDERRIWDGRIWAGADVGRTNDLFAVAVVGEEGIGYRLLHMDTHKNMPFAAQEAVLDKLYKNYHVARLVIDRTGIGAQLAENISLRHETAEGRWFSRQSKERWALNLLKLFEDKRLVIPNNPVLISQLHAVKKKATQSGITYDAARDESGHADAFWALALSVEWLAKPAESKIECEVW